MAFEWGLDLFREDSEYDEVTKEAKNNHLNINVAKVGKEKVKCPVQYLYPMPIGGQ